MGFFFAAHKPVFSKTSAAIYDKVTEIVVVCCNGRYNIFVNQEYGGIDDISYRGIAEYVTYDYVMSLDGIPAGFNQVNITFKADVKL